MGSASTGMAFLLAAKHALRPLFGTGRNELARSLLRSLFFATHPGFFEKLPLQHHRPHAQFIHEVIERLAPSMRFLVSLETGCFLYDLARKGSGQGAIVEIGSYHGASTCCLAAGSKAANREKVYAVDPQLMHRGQALEENLRTAGVTAWVEVCRDFSQPAARRWPRDQKIRLLFIDGDHSYVGAKTDFLEWEPFVCKDGWIVFHDFSPAEFEVCEAVNDFVLDNPAYHHFGRFDFPGDEVSWTFFCQKKTAT